MSEKTPIEPAEVVRLVDGYVDRELDDAHKYTNREPLDESGVFSLHLVAAEVYALGYDAGMRSAYTRRQGERDRDRARAETSR